MNAHPLLAVEGLGLATPAGPVFTDLSFAVPRGALTAVVGPSGSGRSALLLALGGRMRGVTGTVRLGERAARSRPRDLRAHTAVARLATLVEPEGRLTVGESVTERALVDGVAADAAARAVARAEETVGATFDRSLLVDDLSAYDRALLCVALALKIADTADHSRPAPAAYGRRDDDLRHRPSRWPLVGAPHHTGDRDRNDQGRRRAPRP